MPSGIIEYYPQRSSVTTYQSYAQLLQGPTTFPKATSVTPKPIAPTTASPATQPTVAGVEPQAYEAILYGKDIPLFAGAKALIGGRIIEGPYFAGTQADPTVSFVAYHANNIVSHAFQYDLTQVTQARLRGQEVWNADDGYIATDKLPVGSFEWRPGHNAQPPASQSIARFGSAAIAYAGGIISSWENLPLKPFGGIVPFPSILVECTRFGDPDDGIPRSDAIGAILGYMGLRANEFDVDVTGSDPAWLISNNMTLEEFLQQLRAVHVNYHITYTDKLRIVEPAEFAASFDLTNDNILRDSLQFRRTDPLLTSIEKQYAFIDIERDYEPNVASAREEHYPHPTTDATRSIKIELPVVTTSAQALADIHQSLYEEMSVRNMMDGVGDVTLFGMSVGDGVRFADSDVINFFARVMETTHDFENWTVQFSSGEVLNCGFEFETDPYIDLVKLLLGFNDADGETDFVDESSYEKVMTYNDGAVIDTAESRFGGSSLKVSGNFPGDEDFVAVDAVDNDFNLLPAGWTFEGRFKFAQTSSGSGDRALFGCWFPPTDGYLLRWMSGSLDWFMVGGTNFSYSWTPTLDQWYAIAIDFDGTTCRMYIDGAMVASTVGPQDSDPVNSETFAVGCQGGLAGGRPFNGWIDEFRFTNGLGRYASDSGYTVATSQFPRP